MFQHFFFLELRGRVRSWLVWVCLAGCIAIGFGVTCRNRGFGIVHNNAPWVIELIYVQASQLALLFTLLFVNEAAARDFFYNTWQILFSNPLKKSAYLFGRFFGAALVALIPLMGISIGVLLSRFAPWVDTERWGRIFFSAHLISFLVIALPNTIFAASLIFAIAASTRSTLNSILGALGLLAANGLAETLVSNPHWTTFVILCDPFGIWAFHILTAGWSPEQRNIECLGPIGLMLWNRIIWLSVSALIFMIAYWRFRFAERNITTVSKASSPIERIAPGPDWVLPHVAIRDGLAVRLEQIVHAVRLELKAITWTPLFAGVVATTFVSLIPRLSMRGLEGFGLPSFPVTAKMVQLIATSGVSFFSLAIITFYAGILVRRGKDARMDEIEDTLPVPNSVFYIGKFLALVGVLYVMQGLGLLAGIIMQIWFGYHRHQLGLYGGELFLIQFSALFMWAIFAFFTQVISPNKYVGFAVFIGILVTNHYVLVHWDIETHLLEFAIRPMNMFSDLTGRSPFWLGWIWFTTYWLWFCALLAVGSLLAWPRGREQGYRWRSALSQFDRTAKIVVIFCVVGFATTGGWIYYNTLIVNDIVTDEAGDDRAADYEKNYKQYENLPQPSIVTGKYLVNFFPRIRGVIMTGDQVVENKTEASIKEIHFTVSPDYDTDIQLDGATARVVDSAHSYRIFRLITPMAPGDQRHLRFTVRDEPRGFPNDFESTPSVLPQYSSILSDSMPRIGYRRDRELTDINERKDHGLDAAKPIAMLDRNAIHRANSYLRRDSDWVMEDIVVGTSEDQIAVAPGSLVKKWSETGRRYFEYRLDHSSLNSFYAVSGVYRLTTEEDNGVSLELYYDAQHAWNVPKIMGAMRETLDYCTRNFGPYRERVLRIVEISSGGPIAFPTGELYPQNYAFIAHTKNKGDADPIVWAVAHDVAAQWWGQQIAGADMQGANILSDTVQQYVGLMMVEHTCGREAVRRLLSDDLFTYAHRHNSKEKPLNSAKDWQSYIYANKGAMAMYYFKQLAGETAVNHVLANLTQKYAYAPPPYPTSLDLEDVLRAELPIDRRNMVTSWFDEIDQWTTHPITASASKREDGKYDVTIVVSAQKRTLGNNDAGTISRPIKLDDWIEIGVFGKSAVDGIPRQPLHLEFVHLTKDKPIFTFIADKKPDFVGVDPYSLMIDFSSLGKIDPHFIAVATK